MQVYALGEAVDKRLLSPIGRANDATSLARGLKSIVSKHKSRVEYMKTSNTPAAKPHKTAKPDSAAHKEKKAIAGKRAQEQAEKKGKKPKDKALKNELRHDEELLQEPATSKVQVHCMSCVLHIVTTSAELCSLHAGSHGRHVRQRHRPARCRAGQVLRALVWTLQTNGTTLHKRVGEPVRLEYALSMITCSFEALNYAYFAVTGTASHWPKSTKRNTDQSERDMV